MKKVNIILAVIALSLAAFFVYTGGGESAEYSLLVDNESGDTVDVYTHEQYLSIPDIVYENIVLLLDDNYTEYDVVKYYNEHRAWADSIQIDNLENK